MKKHNNRYPVTVSGLSVSCNPAGSEKDFGRKLKLFNKKVQEAGLIKEIRDRMYHETDTEKRQRKKKMARKRWLKKLEQLESESRTFR